MDFLSKKHDDIVSVDNSLTDTNIVTNHNDLLDVTLQSNIKRKIDNELAKNNPFYDFIKPAIEFLQPGIELMKLEKYDDAIDKFEELNGKGVKDSIKDKLFFCIGLCHENSDRIFQAIKYYNTAEKWQKSEFISDKLKSLDSNTKKSKT